MRFLSFFSGAMGLDLGLEQAGFAALAANENDTVAARTIRRNRPGLTLFQRDVRSLDAQRVRNESGLGQSDLALVVGGPPCQAFSTAGRRGSVEDERGSVAFAFLSLAIQLEPQWIVLENVRGLLSAPLRHRPHAQRGEGHPPLGEDEAPGGVLRRIESRLAEAGYSLGLGLYDASLYGAAQRRERLLLVASRDGMPWPLMPPLNSYEDAQTFRKATKGLEMHEHLALRPGQAKYLAMLGPGQNWRDLPGDLQREALGGAFESGGGRTGFLRRLAWDEPSPTLVTSPTMPATLLAHPTELRPLSVEEYKRLQGFPDDWVIEGTTAQKYRQLGNAVPIALARALGKHLLEPRVDDRVMTSRYRAYA
ncbi:MAG: DNA cytosine methyltransferase [Fimbriimonadaceae bacterium]